MSEKLEQIIAAYFADLRDKRGLGAGTPERSYYPAIASLLDAIGDQLKPKVLCLSDLGNTGAGQPDFGLYVANQVQKGEPRKGQAPERGVIEMKPVKDDAWLVADTKQVSKYLGAYRLVIVTNLRDFLILGDDAGGRVARLETFRLAKSEAEFWEMVASPQKSAKQVGRAFSEYLSRALTQSVALRDPKDVAWFLASYARDALQRVEEAGEQPALASIRTSLEEALGVKFEHHRGDHFFRSTLVQTLFYGVFSAWVLWSKTIPRPSPRFDWKSAIWYLNVPFVTALFQQLASPAHLQPLHLVELMDWAAATLNRVDTTNFIARFNEADAVQFFYEPFLEAFDPELRKELGVWYTPTEIVNYMVARVDKALRDELGVADGLASEEVYILDPCCGTGSYLAAVLKRIDATLADKGLGALKGQMVKKAATTRVFGFEILPAPFVVAHLKVGLVLQLDDAIGLSAVAGETLADTRTGKNGRHALVGLLRQSVFGRLAGYDDVNDADRLRHDPAMRWIVGGKAAHGSAASPSQMGRFETRWLTVEKNLLALADLSGRWIDIVHGRRPPRGIVLDMDSSVSPTHGEQENSVWNGHYACTCYHPLFVFNQFGDLERCALRPGNVHSADGWKEVLDPVVARYRGKVSRIYFRADAGFANPEVYEFLEAERIKYAIRLPKNPILQGRIGYLLKRPVGRPSNDVRRFHANFTYQAGSWTKPRRVIAKVEWHPGELIPRVGFIVTNLSRPAERVVAFYNKRGTCEQWIKEGKGAIKWTRLSCCSFAANAVRLQLHALAYNLGNFLRTLATPEPIKDWSLTSLKEKLIKIGAKVVSHGRYVAFQMAEVAIPRQMFQEILRLIAELRPQPPPAPA